MNMIVLNGESINLNAKFLSVLLNQGLEKLFVFKKALPLVTLQNEVNHFFSTEWPSSFTATTIKPSSVKFFFCFGNE